MELAIIGRQSIEPTKKKMKNRPILDAKYEKKNSRR